MRRRHSSGKPLSVRRTVKIVLIVVILIVAAVYAAALLDTSWGNRITMK